MAALTKWCALDSCGKKFRTYRSDQEFCSVPCKTAAVAQEREKKILNGKKVLFMAKGAKEDGLHPNDRQLVPRQSFAVEQQ